MWEPGVTGRAELKENMGRKRCGLALPGFNPLNLRARGDTHPLASTASRSSGLALLLTPWEATWAHWSRSLGDTPCADSLVLSVNPSVAEEILSRLIFMHVSFSASMLMKITAKCCHCWRHSLLIKILLNRTRSKLAGPPVWLLACTGDAQMSEKSGSGCYLCSQNSCTLRALPYA